MPRNVLPFALRGGKYLQIADPAAARAVPLIFWLAIEPVQVTRLGWTAAPPAVRRTEAETVAPALGLAGASFTELADTAAGGGAVGTLTTTVAEAVLLVMSGSTTEVCVISAWST